MTDAYCSVGEDSICDAWELRTDQNEDIPELTPFQQIVGRNMPPSADMHEEIL